MVADVAAESPEFPLAVAIQDVGSKERLAAAGRFEAAREHDCSVAQRAGDHSEPAVLDGSAPVGWEPAGLVAPDLVEHDFPAESAQDDHSAPAAAELGRVSSGRLFGTGGAGCGRLGCG